MEKVTGKEAAQQKTESSNPLVTQTQTRFGLFKPALSSTTLANGTGQTGLAVTGASGLYHYLPKMAADVTTAISSFFYSTVPNQDAIDKSMDSIEVKNIRTALAA